MVGVLGAFAPPGMIAYSFLSHCFRLLFLAALDTMDVVVLYWLHEECDSEAEKSR